MKRFYSFCIPFLTLVLFFNCKEVVDSSLADSENEETSEDRNMFGHYIPRGLTKTSENLTPGYAMFSPINSASTYLVNRDGLVVHEWKGNYGHHTPYLNDDGSLTLLSEDPDFPVFAGGGEAGRLQKISWDSKVLWDFEYADKEKHTHHDIAVKPNGNILAIAWEARSAEEAIQAGRMPEKTPKAGLWPTRIVEIEPDGKHGGKEVWMWQIWDHLIQDFDPEKDNYGDVAAHPELLDINVGRPLPPEITEDSMDILQAQRRVWRNQTHENRGSDIYHVNAINYNEELDQIVFSSPQMNEIYIIDHSTTTEEARGHTGGRYGKGGDFLFRWGNPINYRKGDSLDRQLFGQHDVRWIEKGKPGAGHLTVFNNDVPNGPDSLDYSAVYELKPIINESGEYRKLPNGRFAPEDAHWKYIAQDTISFFGSFVSGAHRMENGNTFINEGPKGRYFEVTPEGEIVWEYLTEHRGNIHHPNGDPKSPMPFAYLQFRSTFIPADHPALKGKDLKPLDPQPEKFKLPPREEKEE